MTNSSHRKGDENTDRRRLEEPWRGSFFPSHPYFFIVHEIGVRWTASYFKNTRSMAIG